MSEEEAFEHAIEMIQTRQMGFRKAADFFSVSKWKLYKTARKRGIYAEIKKQNQAQVIKRSHFRFLNIDCLLIILQQALTKVPTNVQHFADLGVYKQLKKKTHLTKDGLFPHLPGHHPEADARTVISNLCMYVPSMSMTLLWSKSRCSRQPRQTITTTIRSHLWSTCRRKSLKPRWPELPQGPCQCRSRLDK